MSIVIGKFSQQKAPIAGAFLVSADSYEVTASITKQRDLRTGNRTRT